MQVPADPMIKAATRYKELVQFMPAGNRKIREDLVVLWIW